MCLCVGRQAGGCFHVLPASVFMVTQAFMCAILKLPVKIVIRRRKSIEGNHKTRNYTPGLW